MVTALPSLTTRLSDASVSSGVANLKQRWALIAPWLYRGVHNAKTHSWGLISTTDKQTTALSTPMNVLCALLNLPFTTMFRVVSSPALSQSDNN